MNNEHTFLITYGLHNFVSCAKAGVKSGTGPSFIIQGIAGQKMIRHAKTLIVGSFGPGAEIRMA